MCALAVLIGGSLWLQKLERDRLRPDLTLTAGIGASSRADPSLLQQAFGRDALTAGVNLGLPGLPGLLGLLVRLVRLARPRRWATYPAGNVTTTSALMRTRCRGTILTYRSPRASAGSVTISTAPTRRGS